jgi:predicted nucleic-acid-binding Zn-ribbon protein
MSNKNLKPKKTSEIEIINTYANNEKECINFFYNAKWPTTYICPKCGCTHYNFITRHNVFQCAHCKHQEYLHSGTIFQGNKLPLFKLILGMYLVFSSNKGITAIELSTKLDINYKSALRLNKKCRILMSESNGRHQLDAHFYEADIAYIGTVDKCGKRGLGSSKQAFAVVLGTDKFNNLPTYALAKTINVDNQINIDDIFSNQVILNKDKTLTTDGKTTFYNLRNKVNLNSIKINYKQNDHELKYLNILISNIKNNILGIYHGISKRDLPLFISEAIWRFNHRYVGNKVMDKISNYITMSQPFTDKIIKCGLNTYSSSMDVC